jgi:hypothetical protein
MGWDYVSELQPPVGMLFIPQTIWTATVEYIIIRRKPKNQEKTEEPGEKPVAEPLCPPQISRGLTRVQTRTSAVRGRWLTAWAMARPSMTYIWITWEVGGTFEWFQTKRNLPDNISADLLITNLVKISLVTPETKQMYEYTM